MTLSRLRRRPAAKRPCVVIYRSALEHIHGCAKRSAPREGGGILLGHRTDTAIVVVDAVEVEDPTASTNRYYRDARSAQRLLDKRLPSEPATSLLGFVGDWHSHPRDTGASTIDLATLQENAMSDGDSLALIVVRRQTAGWTEAGYVVNRPARGWLPAVRRVRRQVFEVPVVVRDGEAGEREQ